MTATELRPSPPPRDGRQGSWRHREPWDDGSTNGYAALAKADVLMLHVAHLTYRCNAGAKHLAHFTGRKAENDVFAVLPTS